ncbi:MAG: hypothetical protein ACJAYU_001374 [Bradymonadia bacterium]|jgi:uncharacterized protein YbjT (DUF2867 family)
MIAFVIGATGYTGRAIVAELRSRGIETHAHIRPGSTRSKSLAAEFGRSGAIVNQTPWELEAFERTIRGVQPDIIFGCLGITRSGAKAEAKRTGKKPSYEAVDYGLTVLTADACVAAGVSPRFVYLSSHGTNSASANEYLKWRWKTEEHLRGTGIPCTFVRPSFITGGEGRDESRPLESVGAAVAGGALSVLAAFGVSKLKARFRPRTNVELASKMVELAIDPAAANTIVSSEQLG